jgi:nucleotide-binding universal stress UspA family protein
MKVNSFSTILIPVDLTINTEVAVKKGIELADDGTTIHLLYVLKAPWFSVRFRAYSRLERPGVYRRFIVQKITQLHQQIRNKKPAIAVHTSVSIGRTVQRAINEKAAALKPDLIIIGKHTQRKRFPFLITVAPRKIVQQTGIPVLTVRPGCMQNSTRTVVIPITGNSIDNKMKMIEMLSRKYRLKVYLVTFLNKNRPDDSYSDALLKVYRWLKEIVHCPVDYVALRGENKGKTILDYAHKVDADLLLIYPESETKIGWLNHVSDVLLPVSRLQVLVVRCF